MRLRDRLTKAGFFTSGDLLKLPRDLRNFYRDLWHAAEDSGCLADDPFEMKVSLYPSPLDAEITPQVIEQWVARLVELNKLVPYRAQGRSYLWLRNFSRHQKVMNCASPSLPLPGWIKFTPYNSNSRQGTYEELGGEIPETLAGTGSLQPPYNSLTNPFQPNQTQPNQTQPNQTEINPTQPNPSEPKPSELNPSQAKPGESTRIRVSEKIEPPTVAAADSPLAGLEKRLPGFREDWGFFRKFPHLRELSFVISDEQALARHLKLLGVGAKTLELWKKKYPERIKPQLEHLPFREVESSPAGLLVQAVNEDWDLPALPRPKTKTCRDCGKETALPIREWGNLNREKIYTCKSCLERPLTAEEQRAVAEAKRELLTRRQRLNQAGTFSPGVIFAPA